MSHGLVNNVFRSHSAPQSIAMVAFIPAVVSHPIIRKKCVLHIMDASRGVWDGGPFGKTPSGGTAARCSSQLTRWPWTAEWDILTPAASRWGYRV
jgi:hypothetical protein